MTAAPERPQLEAHLAATLEAARRWQLGPEAGEWAGGLACPVARVPMQWTEFLLLPVAAEAAAREGSEGAAAALARGLVAFLARVQREDGTFDAGFCGDPLQPCNAAFALRPLATALARFPEGFGPDVRAELARVVEAAARACAEGGMTTPNHRWVAAAGLAHAASALGEERFRRAAEDWTRAGIDVDADGGFSEGSPNYAVVSADCLLDLETLCGREDLGDVARRSLAYLRAVQMPDGGFAAVGSSRYDTEGSTDAYARAACVLARLGDGAAARRALAKLWSARSAPGLLAPSVFAPLDPSAKGKLYPSVVSAIGAESLQRLLHHAPGAVAPGAGAADAGLGEGGVALPSSGLVRYGAPGLALAAGPGPNLLEAQAGGAALEGARLLAHVFGWNLLYATERELDAEGMTLALSNAPGSDAVRIPQFHRDAPAERRPGNAVPPVRARLALRFGPGAEARLDVELEGPPGLHALLELAARPDQALFDASGAPLAAPVAAPPAGRLVVAGPGPGRLLVEHAGGSGHALQVERYGYGAGDALWSPSFRPRPIRIGLAVPGRLALRLRAV